MTSLNGSFIWYELLTSDPDAAQHFYADVVGWKAALFSTESGYRIFSYEEASVAGLMKMPDGAPMPSGWFAYIGVDDVDAAVRSIEAAGGRSLMPAMDLPNVGRMAMLADPQGAPFYVMRPEGEGENTSFSPTLPGRCSWNELATSDQKGALAFYKGQFGWSEGGSMPMGEMGDYVFIVHDETPLGAVMTRRPDGPPPMWLFYFRVKDVSAAAERIKSGGGTVMHGPVEVPGGDFIVVATDPQGAAFGLVGPQQA